MQKVNRLVWAANKSVTCYGVRIGLRANSEPALQRLLEYLPPQWKSSKAAVVERLYSVILSEVAPGTSPVTAARAGVKRFNILYSDFGRAARSLDAQEVLTSFENDVQMYVAENAPGYVFVHAGVVAWHNQAIVIPGRSFSGKTTLVAALLEAGATYYSDEYAVIDEHGQVHPYPRALSMRGEDTTPPTRQDAVTFGAKVGRQPLPIGCIVATHYRSGARWRPQPLSSGLGVLKLLENAVAARSAPETVLSVLRHATPAATVLTGVRGPAEDVAADLLRRLGA